MKKNLINLFALLVLSFALVSSVHAYGGGGSSKKCKRPVFTEKSPPNGSVVSPKSGFSFVASANTKKSSIVVKSKMLAIDWETLNYHLPLATNHLLYRMFGCC